MSNEIISIIQNGDWLILFSAVLGSFLSIINILTKIKNIEKNKNEKLSKLDNERAQLESKIEEENNENVRQVIKLNLNSLERYYTTNQTQSENSYKISVLMIIIGFVLVTLTIIMLFVDSEAFTLTIITGLAGIVSKFIGLTSLYLFKESNKNVNEFVERLSYLRNVMLAVDLAEKMPDDKKYEQIANIISGLMSSD